MPHVPYSSHTRPSAADAQINAAVTRLVDLFAGQVARELLADALNTEEPHHAAQAPQKD